MRVVSLRGWRPALGPHRGAALFFGEHRRSETTGIGGYRPGEGKVVEEPHPATLVPHWSCVRHGFAKEDEGVVVDGRRNDERMVEGSGFPVISLWCEAPLRHGDPPTEGRGFVELPLQPITWSGARYARVLPLLPVWPGFAINTISYALLLWMPFMSGD